MWVSPFISAPLLISKIFCSARSMRVFASSVPSFTASMMSLEANIRLRAMYLSTTIAAYFPTVEILGTAVIIRARYSFACSGVSKIFWRITASSTVTISILSPARYIFSITP